MVGYLKKNGKEKSMWTTNLSRVNKGGIQTLPIWVKGIIKRVIILLKRIRGNFLPLRRNVVLFDSFFGSHYNDNPRYISEMLYEIDPSVQIVWAVDKNNNEKGKGMVPSYAECVQVNTKAYDKLVYSANVVVDNGVGLKFVGEIPFRSNILRKISRRKDQLCISTWHGTPLKRTGKDQWQKTKIRDFISSTDYCIAGNQYTAKILESAYFMKGRIKNYGTPRNDIFFRSDLNIVALKEKLHLPIDKKIILFAPTFRDTSVEWSGVEQMNSLDIDRLLILLEQRFGGEFVLAFRVHHMVMERINSKSLMEKYGKKVIDGNLEDDMAEYLACADVLLTDYSGSMFDYALTYRPCFLFAPDREEYQEVRGFYMDYDKLPFPIAYSSSELYDCIQNFDAKEYDERVKKFMKRIGNFEDGHAAERVAKDILSFLKSGEKQYSKYL